MASTTNLSDTQHGETLSSDLQAALAADDHRFPFRVELSLEPLIRFWTRTSADEPSSRAAVAGFIRRELEQAPELAGAIDDLATLGRHRELVDLLMTAVFSPVVAADEYGAALVPFQLRAFHSTPPFTRLLVSPEGRMQGRVNLDAASLGAVRRLYAYALVLHRVYGIDLHPDYTLIVTVTDPETRLDRHFQAVFDWRCLDVVPVGTPPVLPAEARERLAAGIIDPDRLPELVPADRFVLRGFTIFKAVEVTDQQVLSSLQQDLIDKASIVSAARFEALQGKLQTLFRRPELTLGLAAIAGEEVLLLNHGAQLRHGCIFSDSAHQCTGDFAGSIFERAVRAGRPLIVEDLAAEPSRTAIEEDMLAHGVRNVVVAPLTYQERLIGTLKLVSPRPGDLNATHLPKLQAVLPLFAVAVQRSMDELNMRVQAIIKEQCTAIHPAVEWRFRRAVLDGLERRRGEVGDGAVDLGPIVFENVYPLYALSDIRGSSMLRAAAIRADLLTQLGLARAVLAGAHAVRARPALDELRYRIDRRIELIESGPRSGDEVGVIAFMRGEVEPWLDEFAAYGPDVRDAVRAYRAALDSRRGTAYAERRRFEESVTRLTEALSAYLDLEQQTAQAMVPHYFEKQKTDGVDYQIYAGASLCEDGRFDALGLRNLRLWQLMVTCGVALRAHRLAGSLPMPLDVTHLILVQHAPLAIRFRFDEKRFDVDGAYDIRYEIVKKRIDKAVIRGTEERVTQPNTIAIVYTQPAEAQEYRRYIEYLQHLGYLGPTVEELELEELQGVHGLRALRVAVDLGGATPERALGTVERALLSRF